MNDSASAIVARTLAQIEKVDPTMRAFVHVLDPEARQVAAELDKNGCRGLLQGLTFGVKEVIDVAGVQTTGGCRNLGRRIPTRDATVVKRLKAAGSILVGTQVSHELTVGLDEPPTRNPWDLSRYPGGSSAGAGVSVITGCASFALGTDAAGSVRIPAAMTGTVGFKPTIGTVSKYGIMRQASAPSIDNVGIIATTVDLVSRVFDVIGGPDVADPQTLLRVSFPRDNQVTRSSNLRGVKIGVLGRRTMDSINEIYPLQEQVGRVFLEACDRLKCEGAVLIDVEVLNWADAVSTVSTIFSFELADAHRTLLPRNGENYHPSVLGMLQQALKLSPLEIAEAVASRTRTSLSLKEAMLTANVNAIVTPTTPRPAMVLQSFEPSRELKSLIPYTCVCNLTGNPALSVPIGLTDEGIPIGLQVVGRHLEDRWVLWLGGQIEKWHSPPRLPQLEV